MRLEVLWRQLIGIGAEHLILTMDDGVHADGMAVGEVRGSAYRIQYALDCDPDWNVKQLLVQDLLNARAITLARALDGRWTDGEKQELKECKGCSDVDLMITPFTNTIPVRRLHLALAEAREIDVIYVSVPALKASRVRQRYTLVSKDDNGGRYRYENLQSGFTAELTIDTDGLVVDYPNIFTMDAKRRLADS